MSAEWIEDPVFNCRLRFAQRSGVLHIDLG